MNKHDIYPVFSPANHSPRSFTSSFWMMVLLHICSIEYYLFSMHSSIVMSQKLALLSKHPSRRLIIGNTMRANLTFTKQLLCCLSFLSISWLTILLILSGDVHPNPGPASDSSSTCSDPTSDSTLSLFSDFDLSNNLSLIHYNVQSIRHKLDILYSEYSSSDKWLHFIIDLTLISEKIHRS